MKKWYVDVSVERINQYEVEAETAQEAEEMVLSGEADIVDTKEYGWDVVAIEEIKK